MAQVLFAFLHVRQGFFLVSCQIVTPLLPQKERRRIHTRARATPLRFLSFPQDTNETNRHFYIHQRPVLILPPPPTEEEAGAVFFVLAMVAFVG